MSYKVLRDFTHPITGLKMLKDEIISLNCPMSVRMLISLNVIEKVE